MHCIQEFKSLYCKPNNLIMSDYVACDEGKEYAASSFTLSNKFIHFRCAKITPTKVGQFVTFWKRNAVGITAPYDEHDKFDSLIVYTQASKNIGIFIFSKQVLLKQNILTHDDIDGKRGFRVYPIWDTVDNAQAKKTQQWQLQYFVQL